MDKPIHERRRVNLRKEFPISDRFVLRHTFPWLLGVLSIAALYLWVNSPFDPLQNHGQIVYQDSVSNLKRRYLMTKEVSVRYEQRVPKDFTLEDVTLIKVGSYGIKLKFDSRDIPADVVLARLAEKGNLVDITVSDPSLEEVIARIYQEVA